MTPDPEFDPDTMAPETEITNEYPTEVLEEPWWNLEGDFEPDE